MKKRLFIVIAALLGLSLGKANAQNLPQTREAAELLQKGNLALAQEKIDQAVLSEESGFAYSWFIHAYTYKELYKANPKDSLEYTTRKKAIDSSIKCIEKDQNREFKENTEKMLVYLTNTIYNDAVDCASSNDADSIILADYYFLSFEENRRKFDNNTDFSRLRLDLHKTAAQSYQDMYSADHSRSDMLENAIQEYIKALSINSKDYDSNINLAINYYNLGVQEISEINHNTPIQELIMIQEECVGYFKKSLPYMLEAHSQTKERVEPLKGLMAIYKALNDDEKSDDYKEKLSQVIQEE